MTDEERQQAEAYIKLQDNVEDLVGEIAEKKIRAIIAQPFFVNYILDLVVNNITEDPRSELGVAIANHVRLLNRENIK